MELVGIQYNIEIYYWSVITITSQEETSPRITSNYCTLFGAFIGWYSECNKAHRASNKVRYPFITPAICLYPGPDKSNPPPPHPISLRSILLLSSHLQLCLPILFFRSDIAQQIPVRVSSIPCICYEAYSDSKYRFAVKKNRVRFRIKSYCYQILQSSDYFSTYSPPLLRHLS